MKNKLTKNAEYKINTCLEGETNRAIHIMLNEAVQKGYKVSFIQNMQSSIQRIGHMISEYSGDDFPKMKSYTYIGAVEYISKILNDPSIKENLRNIGVNDAGNDIKHQINDVSVDIIECAKVYNKVVLKLSKMFNIPKLKTQLLNIDSKAKTQNNPVVKQTINPLVNNKGRKNSLFKEEHYEKFGKINGVRYEVRLSDKKVLDIYKRKLNTSVSLNWLDCKPNHSLNVDIYNAANGRKLASASEISLNAKGTKNLKIDVGEKELDRRKLDLTIVVSMYNYEKEVVQTGSLWWKKEIVTTSKNEVASDKIRVSNIY